MLKQLFVTRDVLCHLKISWPEEGESDVKGHEEQGREVCQEEQQHTGLHCFQVSAFVNKPNSKPVMSWVEFYVKLYNE